MFEDDVVQRISKAYSLIPSSFEVDVRELKNTVKARRGRRRSIGAVVACGAVATAIGGGILQSSRSDSESDRGHDLTAASSVTVSGDAHSEAYVSSTARDWVSRASLVAVVKVISEAQGTESAYSDGSGKAFVGRSVLLELEQTLWSRSVDLGLPADPLRIDAPGWITTADGLVSKSAMPRQPRLEVGYTYVVALVESTCSSDSVAETGWMYLGSEGVIPFNGEMLGYGESEGRMVAGDVDQTAPGSLERRMIGHDLQDLERQLIAAGKRTPKEQTSSIPC